MNTEEYIKNYGLNLYKKINGVWCPAVDYRYDYSDWSPCVGDCGTTGYQTRSAKCMRENEYVDDKLCNAAIGYPVISRSCNTKSCCVLNAPVCGGLGWWGEQTRYGGICLNKVMPAGRYQFIFDYDLFWYTNNDSGSDGSEGAAYVQVNGSYHYLHGIRAEFASCSFSGAAVTAAQSPVPSGYSYGRHLIVKKTLTLNAPTQELKIKLTVFHNSKMSKEYIKNTNTRLIPV